jgi:hypothetical protein
MTYKFHRCQTHPKCPDSIGWYLELRPDDPETMMKVHRGVSAMYFHKFGMDPHLKPDTVRGHFYNPIRLAALWLTGIERFFSEGETALVNVNGGLMPLDGTIILETVESDDIAWDERFDDEIITVSRWPQAKHFYLCSSKGRLFVPDKYATFEAAHTAALRFVPEERIKSRC